jgi:hypothetical protein
VRDSFFEEIVVAATIGQRNLFVAASFLWKRRGHQCPAQSNVGRYYRHSMNAVFDWWLPEKETAENGYLETNVNAVTS